MAGSMGFIQLIKGIYFDMENNDKVKKSDKSRMNKKITENQIDKR